jgi:cytochrome b561
MKGIPLFKFVLHWITVGLLILSALLAKQKDMPGLPLNWHMIVGAVLLIVVIIRIILRFTHPIPSSENKLTVFVQLALYLSILFILGIGARIAYQRNLLGYLLNPNSAIGRGGFRSFGELHKTAWFILLGLTVIHIGIMLYEHYIPKKDSLS